MPAEEGLGLDVDQSVLPCEEPREQNHGQASGVRSTSRFDLALQIESQLFPKENILRFESSGRTRPQKQEPQNVLGQIKKDGDQPKQGMTASHGIEACHACVAESNSLHFRCVCGHEFSVYRFIAEHNWSSAAGNSTPKKCRSVSEVRRQPLEQHLPWMDVCQQHAQYRRSNVPKRAGNSNASTQLESETLRKILYEQKFNIANNVRDLLRVYRTDRLPI